MNSSINNNRLRICLVSSEYPPVGGGISYYTYNVARSLSKRGHEVTVITRGNWNKSVFAKTEEGTKLYRVQFIPLYPFHVKIHGMFIARLLKNMNLDFDIIHLNTPLVPYLNRLTPYVATQHTIPSNEIKMRKTLDSYSLGWKLFKPYIHYLDKKISINANTLVAISRERVKELQLIYGINAEKIVIVPTGVDTDYFSPSGTSVAENANVLYVGRIDAVKGIEDFITSASYICRKNAGIRFIIVGKGIGNIERNIRNRIHSLNLEGNVQLVGSVDHSNLLTYYQHASVYVLPSYYEGMSLSLLEAMSCGLPCVATNIPGNAEVIDNGINGILVEPGNPEIMAEKVLTLLNNSQLRADIGKNAREKILKHYDWDIIADGLESIYKKNLRY